MADVHTPVGDAPVLPLILMGAGGLVLWFGVHYWRDTGVKSPAEVLKSVLQGNGIPAKTASPTVEADLTAAITEGNTAQAGGGGGGSSGGGGGSTSDVAGDALRYAGHKYVYGGPSNPTDGWDCSSFMSYVIGHDCGLPIPGGTWASATGNGASHGPVVSSYVLWPGARTIKNADVQAGDLIMWPPDTHIGVATSATKFMSALDTKLGTIEIGIADNGPGWIARRMTA